MQVKRIWLLLLALLVFSAGSINTAMAAADSTQQQAYRDAQNDVLSFMNWYTSATTPEYPYGLPTTPAAQNRVVNNLKTITGPGDGNIWKNINSADKVLVSNVGNFSGYLVSIYNDTSVTALNPSLNSGVWVALAPELSGLLHSNFPAGSDPGSSGVWLRTVQALGLSPNGTYSRITEFFINPTQTGSAANQQMFRPAMNTAVDQQVTAEDVAKAAGWTFSTPAQQWILIHPAKDIAEPVDGPWPPSPWTGLGYTYDWNPDNTNQQVNSQVNHYGLTELIAPGANTSATVSSVASIGSYLYAERDSAGGYADELNGSFKIWGVADTVWGKRDFFRKLYYADSRSLIDVTPSGRIENGVLIEDAAYTIRNAGVITALEGRLAAIPTRDGSKTDNVFFINRTSDSYGGSSPAPELTVNIENSGVIGHDGLSAAYTFESSAPANSNAKTLLNISNTGVIYAGSRGLVLTGSVSTESVLTESVNIDNHGALYSGTEASPGRPEGGSGIKLKQMDGSVYVSRGALAINGDVDFQAGSRFFVDLTLNNNPLLTVGKTATLARGAVIEGYMNGGYDHAAPQALPLISATTLSSAATRAYLMQGATLLHTYGLSADAGALSALYDHSAVVPQAKALAEGFLSGAILVNQGADTVAGQGMTEAVRSAGQAARINADKGYGLATFGTLSGGWSRYNTGSHVDMHSFSLMTGLSAGLDVAPGFLTTGVFFEYGSGAYDTYNSFSNAASVDGNGGTYYLGGGILARFEFASAAHKARSSGIYIEASIRAGAVRNEFETSKLRDLSGHSAEYSAHTPYYGLHAGAGYLWNLTDKAYLDLYGKYFWTQQEGASVTLPTNDPVKFDAVTSHRLRGGARFAYAVSEYVSPYIGAACEHEFDGRARAATYGYGISAPKLRGTTGIGELGVSIASERLPLALDFGLQGYAGKREGVSGSLQVKFEF